MMRKVLFFGVMLSSLAVVSAQQNESQASLPRCSDEVAKVRIQTAVRSVDGGASLLELSHDKFRATSAKEVLSLQCFTPSDQPYTVGLVIDYSSSVPSESIRVFLDGVRSFLRAAHVENTYFGVGFKGTPFVMFEPTNNAIEVEHFLANAGTTKRSGKTGLNDAIQLALTKFPDKDDQRRILLVASDGEDNYSRFSDNKTIARNLREAGVRVFLFNYNNSGMPRVRTVNVDADSRLLGYAAETGGLGVIYSTLNPLDLLMEKLSKLFRDEYTIGFTPSEAEGKWRPLTIEVKVPKDYPAIRSTGVRRFFY